MAPPTGPTDVTTLRATHSMPGVRVHRTATLDPTDITREPGGLPLTTVARTLADLAGTLAPHRLERLCHRAQHLRLLDAAVLDAKPTRGSRALANALATLHRADAQITRSELEERFLALVAEAQLPPPLVNTHVAGHEVDFLWPEHRLIAETDGAATHLTPTAFEADRRRDAQLQTHGYRVLRLTWRQVTEDHASTGAALRALLARSLS